MWDLDEYEMRTKAGLEIRTGTGKIDIRDMAIVKWEQGEGSGKKDRLGGWVVGGSLIRTS